jgi:oxygen-independent coproporphyrinogen-3 oxidase
VNGVRHLYIHLPFCAHRCSYCDFVTAVGRRDEHAAYIDALLAEFALQRGQLAGNLETIFLGGGTPTFTDTTGLERLLRELPQAEELTVEANPETVTPELASLLRTCGVTRISLGAQSFQPHLLEVLERRADPDTVRRAFYTLRDASFDNISLDLLYGIPGQTPAQLAHDIDEALALGPDHLSYYELEAKPGTRFTRTWVEELEGQSEAMEDYLETVVGTLTSADYRWYETANFCREEKRARHNVGYWLGRDYLGLGIGAVSTVGRHRWRNRPGLAAYSGALEAGRRPPRDVEELTPGTRLVERLMLGLRLDEPLPLAEVACVVDGAALVRLEALRLVERRGDGLVLTHQGRLLGNGVTVSLLAEMPANRPEPAIA